MTSLTPRRNQKNVSAADADADRGSHGSSTTEVSSFFAASSAAAPRRSFRPLPPNSSLLSASSSPAPAIHVRDDGGMGKGHPKDSLRWYVGSFTLFVLMHSMYVLFIEVILALNPPVRWLLRRLARMCHWFRQHRLGTGEYTPYSGTNLVDPSFDTPNYFPADEFPSPAPGVNMHFCMMVSKLVYEDMAVVRDIAVRKWGARDVVYVPSYVAPSPASSPPSSANKRRRWGAFPLQCSSPSSRLAKTGCFIFVFPHARVLAFRGPSLWPWLRPTRVFSTNMVKTADMGRIIKPIHEALFGGVQPLAHRILSTTVTLDVDTLGSGYDRTYITGHGTGGALASVFTCHIATRGISASGLFTYGQPRAGDAASASILQAALESGLLGELARVVNDADVVPMVPCRLAHSHSVGYVRLKESGEVDFPSNYDVIPDENISVRQSTNPFRGVRSCLRKVVRTPTDESGLRSLLRLMFFLYPGLNDHQPCDYERILRQNVVMSSASAVHPQHQQPAHNNCDSGPVSGEGTPRAPSSL